VIDAFLLSSAIYVACFAPTISAAASDGVQTIQITTATLPAPVLGQAYSQTIATSGGTAPIAFSISGGALPAGLTLNPTTGAITGAPTAAGAYSFTVTATDAAGLTASKTYMGTVAAEYVQITTATLPAPVLGQAYNQTIETRGGIAPITFTIFHGMLPAGLTLNPSTGTITGTPTRAGFYYFRVAATDAAGLTASKT
jgi:large repetitive protein